MLKDHSHASLLLRSPDAVEYPYTGAPLTGQNPPPLAEFKKSPLWMVWPYRRMSHGGPKFCVQRLFAYLSDDGKSWDAAMAVNDARGSHDDTWLGEYGGNEKRRSIYEFWNNIPNANQAWLEVAGLVLFDDILDIDDLGDEYVQAPHIYAMFASGRR